MHFYKKYFDTAIALIEQYNGDMPLAAFLKQYFAQHKKHGSRDRKAITHFCFCYYRLGHALTQLPASQRLLAAIYLCNHQKSDWLSLYPTGWQEAFTPALEQRVAFVQQQYPFEAQDIFFLLNNVSDGIDKIQFALAHLQQPDLFIRIRPGQHRRVIEKLESSGVEFRIVQENCIALNNTTQVDKLLHLNKEAVVQDYSSQRIAQFFPALPTGAAVWDCCAASGGKSILAADTLPNIQLTVSDIRSSIVHNLKARFREAGIQRYQSFVADLAGAFHPKQTFDLVICDAPCSGSGTWARTPEQLFFITEEKIAQYAQLQKKIAGNVAKAVKPGGYLLYITCSVYTMENEAVVAFIQQNTSLQLVKAAVLEGYTLKADTMFAALFKSTIAG